MKNVKQISEADLVLIERYFDYELNEQEIKQFYKRLDSDSNFEKEVGKFKKAHETTLQLFQQSATPQKLTVTQAATTQQTARIVPIRKWLSIAASFVGLLAVGYWVTTLQPNDTQYAMQYSNEMVHKINLDNLDKLGLDRTGGSSGDATEMSLALAFRNKDYPTCIALTEKQGSSIQLATDSLLVRAISFLELEKFDQAEQLFEAALLQEGGQRDIALWGLVHVNLKQQEANFQQARTYLQQLASPDDFTNTINQKAQELLERLPE